MQMHVCCVVLLPAESPLISGLTAAAAAMSLTATTFILLLIIPGKLSPSTYLQDLRVELSNVHKLTEPTDAGQD